MVRVDDLGKRPHGVEDGVRVFGQGRLSQEQEIVNNRRNLWDGTGGAARKGLCSVPCLPSGAIPNLPSLVSSFHHATVVRSTYENANVLVRPFNGQSTQEKVYILR